MAIDKLAPQAYTDLNGLTELKRGAKAQTPEALREAARQFESIFTRMMLKTMREASSGDELFDSQQSGFSRDMFDDQIAVDMSRGHGLGLAEQLVRQMQRAGLVSASGGDDSDIATQPGTRSSTELKQPRRPAASAASPNDFIHELLPSAVAAGRELGVDATTLLAHAALETGWGRAQPTSANGTQSNNLFGIKATAQWRGASVDANTQEFDNGVPVRQAASFRAYDSKAASFEDYVALLRNNPRFAAVLGKGSDAAGFAGALQSAGYATDPRYAEKLVSVAQRMRDAVDNFLKAGNDRPIAPSEAQGT